MTDLSINASNARPSKCVDTTGAVDVDVTVTIDGTEHAGEVTLCPQQYDGRLASWGDCADVWVSGALLRALRAAYSGEDFRYALREIEAHAAEVS